MTWIISATVALAGCASSPKPASEPVTLDKVLRSPFELRLKLDRPTATPGELVYATIEFTNTGRDDLWIPRRREIFFGFEQTTERMSSGMESWQSSCDGLEFVRVRPGGTVAYEKGFITPDLPGEISVYITAKRDVRARLVVEPPPRTRALDATVPTAPHPISFSP